MREPRMPLPSAAVIGGGPAGLMAAEVMGKAGIRVEIFDAMPSVGRKFLLAGRGGLNLTHSEPLERFAARFAERAPVVPSWLQAFTRRVERLGGWVGHPDLCRQQGPGVLRPHEGIAAAARMASAARWIGRQAPHAAPLGRLRRDGCAAGQAGRGRCGSRWRRMRPFWPWGSQLAEARLRWKLERYSAGARHCGTPAATGQLRVHRCMG